MTVCFPTPAPSVLSVHLAFVMLMSSEWWCLFVSPVDVGLDPEPHVPLHLGRHVPDAPWIQGTGLAFTHKVSLRTRI